MAEYIDREHLLTEYCSEDKRTWDNGLWYIEHEPTADVVEREKIDKAIEEIHLYEHENGDMFDCGMMKALGIFVKNIEENVGE